MSIKQKFSREQKSEKDRAENRKFLLIIAVSTVVLMGLMYLAFRWKSSKVCAKNWKAVPAICGSGLSVFVYGYYVFSRTSVQSEWHRFNNRSAAKYLYLNATKAYHISVHLQDYRILLFVENPVIFQSPLPFTKILSDYDTFTYALLFAGHRSFLV